MTSRPGHARPANQADHSVLLDLGPAIVQGGSLLLARHALAFIVTLVGGVILARVLGTATLGVFFASLACFTAARQLIDFSVTARIIRSGQATDEATLARCFWLQQWIAVAVVSGTAIIVGAGWHRSLFPEHAALMGRLLLAAAVGAYFQSWQSIPAARLERGLLYGRVGLVELSDAIVFNLVAVTLALSGSGGWSLVAGLAARGLVPALTAWGFAPFRPAGGPFVGMPGPLRRELASLTAVQGVGWAIALAPPLIIGGLAGPRELAIAQLAYAFLGSLGTLAALGHRLSLPAITRLGPDPAAIRRLVARSLSLLSVSLIPGLFAAASLSPVWVPMAYGAEWAPMAVVMLWGAFPVGMVALLGMFHVLAVSRGLAGLVLKQSVIHLVIFWAVLILAAENVGALALPIAHLLAVPAGILFVRAHVNASGPLDAGPALVTIAAAGLLAIIVWHLASAGQVVIGVVLWFAFLAIAIRVSWPVAQPDKLLGWLLHQGHGRPS